ncbi:MAG: type II toxin-antitoxin system HicA family toxin [Candidatus Altiarchaeota archaeon]
MKLPVVSGEEIIKLLLHEGYVIHSRKGSHVTLKRITHPFNRVTIPLHDTLKKGTLLNILEHVGMTREELGNKL